MFNANETVIETINFLDRHNQSDIENQMTNPSPVKDHKEHHEISNKIVNSERSEDRRIKKRNDNRDRGGMHFRMNKFVLGELEEEVKKKKEKKILEELKDEIVKQKILEEKEDNKEEKMDEGKKKEYERVEYQVMDNKNGVERGEGQQINKDEEDE